MTRGKIGRSWIALGFWVVWIGVGIPAAVTSNHTLLSTQISFPGAETASGFFDISKKEAVRNLFLAVYEQTGSAEAGWTGDIAQCVAGTVSDEFREITLERLDFYRILAGLPIFTNWDDTLSRMAQQAALIMAANSVLTHYPTPDLHCYTDEGARAASNSVLALGSCGPVAVDQYIWDFGPTNYHVGHRRWLFSPRVQKVGLGAVPQTEGHYAANAIWVIPEEMPEQWGPTRDGFVAWPPPGYIPYPLVPVRWSCSVENADFSEAGVQMTREGTVVPVEVQPVVEGIAEPTLVWQISGMDANQETEWPRPDQDTTYEVTITNILIDGVPKDLSYKVTIFDPFDLSSRPRTPVVQGPTNMAVLHTGVYTIAQPSPTANRYDWRYAYVEPLLLSTNEDLQPPAWTASTSSGYSPFEPIEGLPNQYFYHLAHPKPEDQILALNSPVILGDHAVLEFDSWLGWAMTNQIARVQISTDEGVTWTDLFTKSGDGSAGQTNWAHVTLSLTNYAGKIVDLRFVYDYEYGPYYQSTELGVGWHIYRIQLFDALKFTKLQTYSLPLGASFSVVPRIPRAVAVQARGRVWGKYPLFWGPWQITSVHVSDPLQSWIRKFTIDDAGYPVMEVEFPEGPTQIYIRVLTAPTPQGPWTQPANWWFHLMQNSTNRWEVRVVPPQSTPRFYRLEVQRAR